MKLKSTALKLSIITISSLIAIGCSTTAKHGSESSVPTSHKTETKANDVFNSTDAFKNHDIGLSLKGCKPNEVCSSPATLKIMNKGQNKPIQTIEFKSIRFDPSHFSKIASDKSDPSNPTYTLLVDDFNSDGFQDFAIWTEQLASYGGPSYDAYLFDQSKQSYALNNDLTELSTASLSFTVKNGMIESYQKSGCCEHSTTQSKFVGQKLVPVQQTVETVNPKNTHELITTASKRDGDKWTVISTKKSQIE